MDHAELIRRKAKIEALLPLVRPEHVDKLYRRLMRVNAELRLPPESDMPPNDPAASSAGTNGVGGLHFQANAPAGVGRLVRVPLFLSALPTDLTRSSVVTDAGVNQVAAINPVVSVVSDWFAGQPVRTTGMQMRTRVVKFAVLRVVGIKISARFRLQYGFTTTFMAPPLVPFFDRECQQPSLLVKNLVVGGGTNLFPQDDYVDATVYSESVPEFAGLRDYPVLEDPNTCSINVATVALSYGIPASLIPGGAFVAPFGAPAGGSPYVYVGPNPFVGLVRPVTQFSMSLVCEILEDEIVKGVHIPGPYARRDALARLPSPLGMETVR